MFQIVSGFLLVWMQIAVPAEIAHSRTHGEPAALLQGAGGRTILLARIGSLAGGLGFPQLQRLFDAAPSRRPAAPLPSKGAAEPSPSGVDQARPTPKKTRPLPAAPRRRPRLSRAERDALFLLSRPDHTDRYDELVARYADRHGLDPRLVKSVMAAESSFRRKVRSSAGALGLMQLMPLTAEEMGVSRALLTEPEHNIRAGTAYLAYLFRQVLDRYGMADRAFSQAPAWIVRRVLAAYNAGPRFLYRDKWFRVTRSYVDKVFFFYRSKVSDLRRAFDLEDRIPILAAGGEARPCPGRALRENRWDKSPLAYAGHLPSATRCLPAPPSEEKRLARAPGREPVTRAVSARLR